MNHDARKHSDHQIIKIFLGSMPITDLFKTPGRYNRKSKSMRPNRAKTFSCGISPVSFLPHAPPLLELSALWEILSLWWFGLKSRSCHTGRVCVSRRPEGGVLSESSISRRSSYCTVPTQSYVYGCRGERSVWKLPQRVSLLSVRLL